MGSASGSETPTPLVREVRLVDALDLPAAVQEVQSSYWQARRDWDELRTAYELVIAHMVEIHGEELQ